MDSNSWSRFEKTPFNTRHKVACPSGRQERHHSEGDQKFEPASFSGVAILIAGTPNAVAVHVGAPTIPLLFVAVGGLRRGRLVENLAHPGNNVTGFANVVPEGFLGKQAPVPASHRSTLVADPRVDRKRNGRGEGACSYCRALCRSSMVRA